MLFQPTVCIKMEIHLKTYKLEQKNTKQYKTVLKY